MNDVWARSPTRSVPGPIAGWVVRARPRPPVAARRGRGATLTAARAQPRDDRRDRRRLRQWSDEREHLETLGSSGAPRQDRPVRADEISKIRVREHVAQLEQVSLPPSQARGRVA